MTSIATGHSTPANSPLIVVVDADRRVRRSLTDLLSLGGVRVAGSAGDAREAISLLERGQPDLLLIDPQLPTAAAGARLLEVVRRGWPQVRLLVMGWREGSALDSSDDGVAGYVSKGAEPGEFLRAILEALPGSR